VNRCEGYGFEAEQSRTVCIKRKKKPRRGSGNPRHPPLRGACRGVNRCEGYGFEAEQGRTVRIKRKKPRRGSGDVREDRPGMDLPVTNEVTENPELHIEVGGGSVDTSVGHQADSRPRRTTTCFTPPS
jgi:hypothetical protein